MLQRSDKHLGSEDRPVKDKNLLLFLGLRPLIIAFLIFLSYPVLFDIPRLFILILIVAVLLVPIFFLLSRVLSRQVFYYSIFVADSIFVTGLILQTGGSESLFPLLYPIVVLASSIYLYRGAIVIAVSSFLLYSVLIYFELKGGFFPIQYFYARTYLYGILFILVAYLGSNLTTKVKKTEITTAEIIGSLPVYIAAVDQKGNFYYSNIRDEQIKDLVLKFHHSQRGHTELSIDNQFFGLSSHPLSMNPGLRLILAEDITAQKKMAEKTRIYEKLQLLAQLGASLAHEIRNPLASIRGVAEVISKARLRVKQKKLLAMAIDEVDRASRTIEDFLEFSRMRPLKLRKIKLKNILEDLLSTESLPDHINIRFNFADKVVIKADRYLIYRALRNLIQNARQAIGDLSGEIEISSHEKNETVEIVISDNGCGIPKKDLGLIFNPFFSTREDGTGLGLSIVETIVAQHGGTMFVESKIGKGTTFTISLPKRHV